MQNLPSNPIKTSVVIIGGGFSGTMLAVNFIKKIAAKKNFQITIIEKTGAFAAGVAFSTNDPFHFLNVQANKMGAFRNEPDHFFKWIQENQDKWRFQIPELVVQPESYLPRRLYAIYLESLFEQAKKEAKNKGIELLCLTREVIDVTPTRDSRLLLQLKDSPSITTDAMILATSLPPFRGIEVSSDVPKSAFIENIWNPPHDSIFVLSNLSHLDPLSRIVIIGSGLTMVDAVVSLIRKEFKGEIFVVSKEGLPPEPHHDGVLPIISSPINPKDSPKRVVELVRLIRNEIVKAKEKGGNWRSVIDSLRPITVSLWTKLPIEEKKRFIRHLFSFWNRIRHRIPPESYKIMQRCQESGQLHFISEYVRSVQKSNHRLCVMGNSDIEADYVLNCSGAHKDINKVQNQLLQNLLKSGLIQSHELKMGIVVDDHYKVVGKDDLPIYALGQLLIGQRMESVAVPELREQCSCIVDEILSRMKLT